MTGFNSGAFEAHQHYGSGYMLAVILLKNINTLWLGVYTRYTPWYVLVISQYEYDILVITPVRGEAEDEC